MIIIKIVAKDNVALSSLAVRALLRHASINLKEIMKAAVPGP